MNMTFEDPKMEAYFNALPSKTRAFLRNAGVEISTPGELMLIGEHFRNHFEETEPKPPSRP